MTRLVATREAVARLLTAGLSGAAVAKELGVTQATVSYHRRRLGLEIDARCNRRYDWGEVQRHYDIGHSARECMARFGMASKTWHDAVQRGALTPRPAAAPIASYLVRGRRVSRGHLKRRLLADRLKANLCEDCGIAEWRGRPLALALHHVNGDGDDNRLENLRLLCPNCHSQTANFAARNRGRPRLPAGAVWVRNVPHRRLPVRGIAR